MLGALGLCGPVIHVRICTDISMVQTAGTCTDISMVQTAGTYADISMMQPAGTCADISLVQSCCSQLCLDVSVAMVCNISFTHRPLKALDTSKLMFKHSCHIKPSSCSIAFSSLGILLKGRSSFACFLRHRCAYKCQVQCSPLSSACHVSSKHLKLSRAHVMNDHQIHRTTNRCMSYSSRLCFTTSLGSPA